MVSITRRTDKLELTKITFTRKVTYEQTSHAAHAIAGALLKVCTPHPGKAQMPHSLPRERMTVKFPWVVRGMLKLGSDRWITPSIKYCLNSLAMASEPLFQLVVSLLLKKVQFLCSTFASHIINVTRAEKIL